MIHAKHRSWVTYHLHSNFISDTLQVLKRWLKAEPYSADAWLFAALVALKAPSSSQKSTSALLKTATALAQSSGWRQEAVLLDCASAASCIDRSALVMPLLPGGRDGGPTLALHSCVYGECVLPVKGQAE